MKSTLVITWPMFKALSTKILDEIIRSKKRYNDIYAVPRGGVPLGIFLSQELCIPMAKEPTGSFTLIVDDICDSGKTLSLYLQNDKAVLFHKSNSLAYPVYIGQIAKQEEWVEFPWEEGEVPAEDAIVRIIQAIGDNPAREGLKNTPQRVVKSWKELYAGYNQDPKKILAVTFEDGMKDCDELVICRNIEFHSTCEHHMLPIIGEAHVGYLPSKGKVVGLSKLARLVECFARRLQIQEKMTMQIATALKENLNADGVGVIIKAKHFCMCARGVGKQNSFMTTSAMLGVMRDNHAARAEFMKLCEMP